ncbi:TFPI1 inhibitor, partial [Agelaius phoeniceus]|nr:TFPI1 inhibitor [Agelaius phoeniceus]
LPPLKLVHSFCAMKADEGPCKAIHIRYFFSIKSRKCEVFEYGGCHGNENNFLTLEECQEKCVPKGQYPFSHPPTKPSFAAPDFCFHAQEPGVCRGYFTRYFYNKETKLCEAFKYGGCLGNQNNFRSLEECQNTCQDNCELMVLIALCFTLCCLTLFFLVLPEPPALPSLCMTPMDRGLCRAKELRFFYNFSTGRCRPFSYSGCGGNENNFISRKSCLRICKK